jgi:predicted O-methyltransferase YrrM
MMEKVQQIAELGRFAAVQGARALRHEPNRCSEVYRSVFYANPARLERRSPEQLFPGIESVEVSLHCPLREVGGNVWVNELVFLAGICRWLKPKHVFEIGTFNGRTTVNLAANSPEDAVIHTLDIPHDHPALAQVSGEERFQLHANAGALYRNSAFAGKIDQLWADSAEFDEKPFAGKIDLAFIDGSHSYGYIKNDTEKVLRMMTPDGLVIWHEYYPQYPDVPRYLEEHRSNLVHIETTSIVVLRNAGAARAAW